jgi:hypothetical protein
MGKDAHAMSQPVRDDANARSGNAPALIAMLALAGLVILYHLIFLPLR